MNSYDLFFIETLTPMHVGSGDIHFGVVDNLIQRNPVTKIPVINASSLKGSLKEHFDKKNKANVTTNALTDDEIGYLFGKDTEIKSEGDDDETKKSESKPGRMIVFEANLLTLPLRASQKVFFNATSPQVLKDYLKYYVLLKTSPPELNKFFEVLDKPLIPELESKDFVVFEELTGLELEDFDKGSRFTTKDNDTDNKFKNFLQTVFKIDISSLAIFNDSIFSAICERKIPVIARNQIDNDTGTSKNLFYEEVLPRCTKLYFYLGEEKINAATNGYYDKIKKYIVADKEIIQIGANYSIGYGFSKISEVKS